MKKELLEIFEGFKRSRKLNQYNELREEYLNTDIGQANVSGKISPEVFEAYTHARFGYKQGEFHPEEFVFEKAAVYLREFLQNHSHQLDSESIANIQKMIRIADKVNKIEF